MSQITQVLTEAAPADQAAFDYRLDLARDEKQRKYMKGCCPSHYTMLERGEYYTAWTNVHIKRAGR